jgi:hypothetical protein
MLTVRALIADLQQYNPDAVVVIQGRARERAEPGSQPLRAPLIDMAATVYEGRAALVLFEDPLPT